MTASWRPLRAGPLPRTDHRAPPAPRPRPPRAGHPSPRSAWRASQRRAPAASPSRSPPVWRALLSAAAGMTRCPLPRVPAGRRRRHLHPDQPAPSAARTHRTRGSSRGAPPRGPERGGAASYGPRPDWLRCALWPMPGVRPRRMAIGCARSGDGGASLGANQGGPGGGMRHGARTTPEPGLYPEPRPRALTPRLPGVGPVAACLRRREAGLQNSGRGGRAVGGMGAGAEEGVSGPGGGRGAGRGFRDPGGGRVGCCCTRPTAAKSAVHGPALTES